MFVRVAEKASLFASLCASFCASLDDFKCFFHHFCIFIVEKLIYEFFLETGRFFMTLRHFSIENYPTFENNVLIALAEYM